MTKYPNTQGFSAKALPNPIGSLGLWDLGVSLGIWVVGFWVSAFLFLVAAAGCSTDHAMLAQDKNSPDPSVTRSQKPDKPPGEPKSDTGVQQVNYVAPDKPSTEKANEIPRAKPQVFDALNPETGRIMAIVNGVLILKKEVDDAARPSLAQMSDTERSAKMNEIRRQYLDDLIDRELLMHDLQHIAKTRNKQFYEHLKEDADKEWEKYLKGLQNNLVSRGEVINSRKDLKDIVQHMGMDLESMRRRFERDHMARIYLHVRVRDVVQKSIGRQEIFDYYAQHENEFQLEDSVDWQEIFIDASQFKNPQEAAAWAGQLAARARAGEDFKVLVKQYDQGDSSYRNGAGEGHRHGEIRPQELEPILFQMHDGDIGPVTPIGNGFRVFRLVKRQYAGKQELNEQLQEKIKQKLEREVLARESRRFLADLHRKASIELSPEAEELKKGE
jgi:parvulin-like peptidyl-prolyl isomerase